MNSPLATVNKILPFSCVDGPGNRLVIFLQGCNFRCKNCHNPYTIGLCNDCGDCVKTCPHDALHLLSGRVMWDKQACQQCDTCLETCPNSASPMTEQHSVDDIVQLLHRYRPFLSGVTISGGEAMMQYEFIYALFSAIKGDPILAGLTCFIDSNGSARQPHWEKMLPVMDSTMIDLKAWTPEAHRFLTGKDNQRVKDTLQYLAQHNKLYEVRLLVIPHYTDFELYIEPLCEFLHALSPTLRIKLNAFQTHGLRSEAKQWEKASQAHIDQFAQQLRQHGFSNIITPTVYL